MSNNQNRFTLRATLAAVQGALIALAMMPNTYAAETPAAEPAVAESTAGPAVAKSAAEPAAAEPTVAELTKPTSHIELGIGYVSEDSAKAGEYNGLDDKGAYGIANIDLRGGAAYDSDSALRWRIKGTNLDLDTRDVKAEIGQQGTFRLDFGYDELQRNRSDSYQTPYSEAGSGHWVLPSNWVIPIVPRVSGATPNARGLSPAVTSSSAIVGGVVTPPTNAQNITSANIQAQDLPAFHNIDLGTKRQKYNGGISFDIDSQWQFKASVSHEDKDGYKPMGTVTRATGGDISTILPDKIDQTTDQYNVALGFTGEKGFLNAAYYGSFFDNHVNSLSWQNWALPSSTATMSSAPSNEFNQFGLTGGYNFSPTTKLVMNGSYARSTQNDKFLTDASTPLVPRDSLDGLIVTKAFNMKLTAKPVQDLNLSGGYKYEDRDNRTPVNTYGFYDANDVPSGILDTNFRAALGNPVGLGSNININANRPYSKKSNQINLNADYMVTRGQWIGGGYDWQRIERDCSGSWIACADADRTNENTVHVDWRTAAIENVTTKLDYAYSRRTVNYNENAFLAIVPMANVAPTGGVLLPNGVPATAYNTMLYYGLNGYGYNAGLPPVALSAALAKFFPNNNALSNALYQNGNRISELLGMRRFNMADRDRNMLKSSINWQATDRLSLQAGFNWNKDDYGNSDYGLTDGRNWALNLDGTFAVNENLSFNAFYNHEDQQSRSAGNTYTANSITVAVGAANVLSGGCYPNVTTKNQNNKIDPCLNWSADMQDRVDTLGISFKRDKLLAGKLDLAGDLSYTRARTNIGVNGGNYQANPFGAVAPAALFFIPATDLPTVKTETVNLVLSGKYTVNKASSIWAGYNFQHMSSNDYVYAAMQPGGLAGQLPTYEKAPSYNVHTIGVSYIYSFQ